MLDFYSFVVSQVLAFYSYSLAICLGCVAIGRKGMARWFSLPYLSIIIHTGLTYNY